MNNSVSSCIAQIAASSNSHEAHLWILNGCQEELAIKDKSEEMVSALELEAVAFRG